MALVNMTWKPTTIHEVVAEVLQSERHKFVGELSISDYPDILKPQQNPGWLRLLYCIRAPL